MLANRLFLAPVILSVSLLLCCYNANAQTHPDAIYPIPNNRAYTLLQNNINLFTGDVNRAFDLIGISGNNVDYNITALYNSRSAAINNANPSGFCQNVLGGYGWKLMDYPKIVQNGPTFYMLDGYAAYPLISRGGGYWPDGKYYLWQINKNYNGWDIATPEGKHYELNGPPVAQGGVRIWNLTAIRDAVWGDFLSFSYSATGNLTRVNNTAGDTLLLNYSSNPAAPQTLVMQKNMKKEMQFDITSGYLQSITHKKNGHLIDMIGLTYTRKGNYNFLAAIKHYHQVYAQHYDQIAGGYNFTYQSAGRYNYANAMATVTDQAGAVTSYTYIPNNGGSSYRTVQLAVNDGYPGNSGDTIDLNTYTAIQYDTSDYQPDATRTYRYYNFVTAYPGNRYGHAYVNGSINYGFINGIQAPSLKGLPAGYDESVVFNPTMLGYQYLYKVDSDTGNLTTTYHYWSMPTFPRLDKTYHQVHGVGSWVSYTYGTPFNLITRVATSRRTPEPLSPAVNKDSVVTDIQYAFQQYPALASPNLYLIGAKAGEIQSVQEDLQGAFKITSCKCTQWRAFTLPNRNSGLGPIRNVSMRDSLANPSDCFAVKASNSQWIVNNTYNSRSIYGTATDSTDAMGSQNSSINAISPNSEKVIAQFTNAGVGYKEAAYLGFESYESTNGWNLSPGAITKEHPHTGNAAFMPAFPSLTINKFTPDDQTRDYVYGFWYRSLSTAMIVYCQIIDSTGAFRSATSFYMTGTNGEWKWASLVAAFAEQNKRAPNMAFTANIRFETLTPLNFDLAIDDVSFTPMNGTFKANVYEMNRGFITATLGMNGQATHFVRDRSGTLIAQVGPGSNNQISQVNIPYNSRQGSLCYTGVDTFSAVYPNMALNLNAHKGGTWESFADTGSLNFPSRNMVNMQIKQKWLATTGSPASAAFSGNINQDNISVYTELFPDSLTASGEAGFAFQLDSLAVGKDSIINTSTLKFVLTQGLAKLYHGNTICKTQSLASVPNYNTLLVTISNGNFLIAYLNGRYVFECYFPNGRIKGPAQLIATNVKAEFDNFIFLNDVQATQLTFDALMRPRQQLIRRNVNELQVTEMLYGGPLNLPVAETRAGIIGGRNADSLGLSYKPNFASGFNYDSMTLSNKSVLGAAAGYENPFNSSVSYSKDPLTQVTGVGSGGNFTAGKTNDHYTRVTYGNAAGNIFYYTPNDLISITRVSSDSVTTITYQNKEEVTFAEVRIKGKDTLRTQYEYDRNMRLVATYQPNFYSIASLASNNFLETKTYDFTGNMINETFVDAGITQYIYDLNGRLRFRMDAAGMAANPDTIVYIKYDNQGRITEEGFLQQNWDRAALQVKAEMDINYPATGNYFWRKQYKYDSFNDSIYQGKLTGVAVNWNKDSIADIKESYAYDRYGQVIAKGLQVLDFDTVTRVVQYSYDQQGRNTGVQFPGTSHPGLVYTYDGSNNMTAIGIPGDTSWYAAYNYGYTTTETLNRGSFLRTYSYTETGWVKSINDQLFNETVSYKYKTTPDGPQIYDAKIQGVKDYYKQGGPGIQASYSYDNNGRLTVANLGADDPWSLGTKTPLSYDNNGNILSMQMGTKTASQFQYLPGTNMLNTVQGSNQNYGYNANASITTAPYGASNIQYDPLSGLTLNMKNRGGNTLSFEYDGQDQRVLKTVQYGRDSVQQRLYVHGLNDYPLYEVVKSTKTMPVNTFYVYGPQGMVAIQQGAKRYFVLRDYLNSTRMLIDSNNVAKATFNYNSYGTISYSSIDTSFIKMPGSYLYTGQEYDIESGLYNYRARLYDPGIGRFYSKDPARQYASPYEYAGNDPVSNTDPTGTWSFWNTVEAVTAVALVAAAVVAIVPAAAAATATVIGISSAFVFRAAVGTLVAASTGLIYAHSQAQLNEPVYTTTTTVTTTTPATLPPVVAKRDGISLPKDVTEADFGVTARTIAGRYSIIDLTKATAFVPDNSSNSSTKCPKGGVADFSIFPYRPIVEAEDQYSNNHAAWADIYDCTLYINANFFDVSDPNVNPYNGYCTNILGMSVSGNKAISNWQTYPAWTSGNLSYNLDALMIYKPDAPAANGKKAEIVRYKDLSPDFIARNVAYAIGGMYYIRKGADTSAVFGDIVSRTLPKGRTAVGVDNTGRYLLVLEVDSKLPGVSEGITFAEMVPFFTSKGFNNVINLDGDGSSAFYYQKNATEVSSLPMDVSGGSPIRLHRPIPNFIGFK